MTAQVVDIFSDFAINAEAAVDGVWVPYRGDVEFLVARANNKGYRTSLVNGYKRNKSMIDRGGEAADAKSNEVLIDALAHHVLKGWRGTLSYQGKKLEYSVANARTLLGQEGFREWIVAAAADEAAYKAVKDEADEKN